MLAARTKSTLSWLLVDALLLAGAVSFAYQLAFDFAPRDVYIAQFQRVLIPIVAVQILLLWATGLYRRMIRYAGSTEIILIAGALTGSLLIGLLYFYWKRTMGHTESNGDFSPWQWPIPRSVLGINWLAAICLTGGARLLRRGLLLRPRGTPKGARRVLIVGTNAVAVFAARMLRQTQDARAVAFLDESGVNQGRTILGLPVVGSLPDLEAAIRGFQIGDVLIALPESGPETITRVVEKCRQNQIPVRVLPNEGELVAGRRTLGSLREVDVNEVLGREPADLKLDESMNYLRGETVLITGAGGSIGSELCRQISVLEPARLLMLGRGENSLFDLSQNLPCGGRAKPLLITNICDEAKMRHVFSKYRPTIVFHAAAHKHVHLMEAAPEEAVKNNILGTHLMTRLADEFGVKRFVLISTDKAVRPTSVMGASKRIAEQVVMARAANSQTRFVAVRFGNVLGSRGSVVPIFRRQIERGGPVTVTDAKAERYFMTVEEATALVLRAGAVGESGQLCVLDMGEPVLIEDMARNLITLAGLEPGKDIEIEHVGLRPGEKLKEEYLSAQEGLTKTSIGKIFVARLDKPDFDSLEADIELLRAAAETVNLDAIFGVLKRRIPDYTQASRDDQV